MATLTIPHERALTLLFAEIESSAAESAEAFLGTPGTLTERTNENGTVYWVRRFTDVLNRRQEAYIGKSDDPDVAQRVAALRERIDVANATATRVRLLARAGFATVDSYGRRGSTFMQCPHSITVRPRRLSPSRAELDSGLICWFPQQTMTTPPLRFRN